MAAMDILLPHRSAQVVTPISRTAPSFLKRNSPSRVDLGKLPALSFGKFSLGDDYLAFICDFTTVAEAYQALGIYRVSQYCTSLLGDASDLFESRLNHTTPPTWRSWRQ
uniref:Uncharacterized protein n=1 Tax=Physcomitrium patens TaxID=3218 RepID=A0A7I3ZKG4_PHYPA